jgi:hypothetical protein
MTRYRICGATALLLGLGLTALSLWLGATGLVAADGNVCCVNPSGTGCDAVCGGGCYASVQAAVDDASPGGEVRIAAGTYTDAAGSVAIITKALTVRGGYGQACGDDDLNPDAHRSALDAEWGGSVISITNAGQVGLHHLTLTRGDGTGNMTGGGGGGMRIQGLRPVTIANNLVVRNCGGGMGGGGMYLLESPNDPTGALVVNNTIADNTGNGIGTWGQVILTMTNNVLHGNPVGIHPSHPASLTLAADTNLFWNASDPVTGANAILQDPLLLTAYRPGEGSPALDAGLTIPWLTTDLDGNPRPEPGGTNYDIGAFEGAGWEVRLPLLMRQR